MYKHSSSLRSFPTNHTVTPQGSILALFRDPLLVPAGVFMLNCYYQLLSLHKISVKTMKICSQSELDGGKTGKIEAVGQLKPFLAL